MVRKTGATARIWPSFRCWEAHIRAIVASAGFCALAAVNGAGAEVVALPLDSCSPGCASDIEDSSALAGELADDQATLSLVSGDLPQAASFFDKKTVPEVLAAGFPSALFPNRKAETQDSSSFQNVFASPDEIGAPGLFLSADSLTGLTLGEFLSDSHDYFSETLSVGQAQIPSDLNVIIVRRTPRESSFSSDSAPTPTKKATLPTFPSIDLSDPASQ
jgi:hypothetical protein